MRPDAVPPRGRAIRPALLLATAGGLGYAPVAPGTVGSLPGVALAWIVGDAASGWALAAALAVVAAAGTWAAGVAARHRRPSKQRVALIEEPHHSRPRPSSARADTRLWVKPWAVV